MFTRIRPLPRFPFEGEEFTHLYLKRTLETDTNTLISLKKMNGGELMSAKARRILALLNDPRRRTRVLDSLNKSTLDDVGPVGGDQEIKVLKELNEMQDLQGDAGKENPDR
jgi:hypothetical protein